MRDIVMGAGDGKNRRRAGMCNEQGFSDCTLEEALAWCLVWLMVPELGIGPFVV
jgi:hypothetical protein